LYQVYQAMARFSRENVAMNAEEIIKFLRLQPHPKEGGFFRETYRSVDPFSNLPNRYRGQRSASTAIYYLLTPDSFSAMHRLASDEIFHFYKGDAVEMLQLFPDGQGKHGNRLEGRTVASNYSPGRRMAG
jgi:predicted cupin superfamily sugar epimerase